MGLIANYMEADDVLLQRLQKLDNEELLDTIEELGEEEEAYLYDMDKLWDGLHCLLTGVSAGEPIAGDLLSEAIVGEKMFLPDDENADFIAYIRAARLPIIVDALVAVEAEPLRQRFQMEKFRQLEIYPDIWENGKEEDLFAELWQAFCDLRDFYKQIVQRKQGVVVSIY